MPRRRRKYRGGSEITRIQTANKNLNTIRRLSSAKPPLQVPGQLYRPLMYGGALTDRYGAYLYLPKI